MADYHNSIIIEGTVEKVEYTPPGDYGAKLKITFVHRYRAFKKVGEDFEEYTAQAYYTVTLWKKRADETRELVKSGMEIRVAGVPRVHSWIDNNGEEHIYKTPEIVSARIDLDHLRAQRTQPDPIESFADDPFGGL